MRSPSLALALALALATAVTAAAAHAQSQGDPPADPPADCSNLTQTSPPPMTGGGGDAVAVPGGFLQVLSPPYGAAGVPRNVEIRLSGDVAGLDASPPTFTFDLRDTSGASVPFVRTGGVARPAAPLAPNAQYNLHLEATDANPCPQCMPPSDTPFFTGADVDTTAPILVDVPPADVFVMPDPALAAKCGLFFSQTHQVWIDFGPGFPLDTWIDVAGRSPAGDSKHLVEQLNSTQAFPVVTDLGPQLPVALGDRFVLAFTPRDFAGNVGATRILQVRARTFTDENTPHDQLPPQWCELPAGPQVIAPSLLPQNGRIEVTFPFEEIPLALRDQDGNDTPLIPVDDVDGGHAYGTVQPLPAGRSFDVVSLACPHCVCPGCDPAPGTPLGAPIVAGDVTDTTPPHAPVVRSFGEDAAPAPAVGGACRPDRPALLVVLDPGVDDVSKPLDLRYDGVIRIADGPPLVLGHGIVPYEQKDGATVLRIETRGLGRVLGERFSLTLTAVDAAGNSAESTTDHGVDEAGGGCAASGSPFALAGLALLLLLRRRRALRAPARRARRTSTLR